MRNIHSRKKDSIGQIALQRVADLLENCKRFPGYSSGYISLVKKLKMHHKLSFPWEISKQFCKHCDTYFVIGETAQLRASKKKITITCLNCRKKREHLLR